MINFKQIRKYKFINVQIMSRNFWRPFVGSLDFRELFFASSTFVKERLAILLYSYGSENPVIH